MYPSKTFSLYFQLTKHLLPNETAATVCPEILIILALFVEKKNTTSLILPINKWQTLTSK